MGTRRNSSITLRSFLTGLVFVAFFAGLTVYASDRLQIHPTANQIPVLPYVLLVVSVLLINPVCRLVRIIRPLTQAEILVVFMMGVVSAGISTFGLSAQLIPIVGSLYNRAWNTEQAQWNRYVAPYISESFYVAVPGLQAASRDLADALTARERTVRDMEESLRNPDADKAQKERLRNESIEAEDKVASARQRLAELEEDAFSKVEVFRRGLPRGLRAYPGIFKMPEDSMASYLARLRRMTLGRKVAAQLRQVRKELQIENSGKRNAAADKFLLVSELLSDMGDTQELVDQVANFNAVEMRLNGELSLYIDEISELHQKRRLADRREALKLEQTVAKIQRQIQKLRKQQTEQVRLRESVQQQIETLSIAGSLSELASSLAEGLQNGTVSSVACAQNVRKLSEGLGMLDGTLRRFLIGDVPWKDWARPLGNWALLIGCTYLVLMALNVLMFRQWAYHEKLVYPLAELPLALTGLDPDGNPGKNLYKTGLFWLGLSITGIALGYNILAATKRIPGLHPLDFNNLWKPYIENTGLEGLLGGLFSRSHIFFTMIGLSFLIPTKVSFSLWFFSVFSMIQVLVMVGFGYAQNEASFPLDWYYTLNFRTAQGFGAMIVFSSMVLYKCRAYLGCVFKPQVLSSFAADEQKELKVASSIFWLGSVSVILILWRGMGANPFYALAAWLIILVITIGLVRAVAEGGILGFQAWVSPFHLIRTLFGMNRSWTSPGLFMPIMLYYAALFLDIKTFIAPAMANCLKIRDSLRLERGKFHLAMLLAMAAAAIVAIGMTLLMCYASGADLMYRWFFTSSPLQFTNMMATMSRTPPDAASAETLWLLGGAFGMILLLVLRQSIFWIPHPIGLIMLVNPIMGAYWFSIMLGWLAKLLVTRYGNKDAYQQVRPLFVGLIAGELLMVVTGMLVAYLLEVPVPISLNRN